MTTITRPATLPWEDLWLNRGFEPRQVPGSAMIEIHGVRGFLMPGDVQFMWDLAASLPQGGTHVEIGSWMGLSSIVFANSLLAHLNFDARIHCVDTWEGSAEHVEEPEIRDGTLFETFLQNLRNARVQHLVRPLRGPSARMAAHFEDGSVDSIFVDGDHSYEGCRADIEAWLPKLEPGGRIAGHDAVPGGGVRQAVEEIAAQRGFHVEYLAPPHGHFVWKFSAGKPE